MRIKQAFDGRSTARCQTMVMANGTLMVTHANRLQVYILSAIGTAIADQLDQVTGRWSAEQIHTTTLELKHDAGPDPPTHLDPATKAGPGPGTFLDPSERSPRKKLRTQPPDRYSPPLRGTLSTLQRDLRARNFALIPLTGNPLRQED